MNWKINSVAGLLGSFGISVVNLLNEAAANVNVVVAVVTGIAGAYLTYSMAKRNLAQARDQNAVAKEKELLNQKLEREINENDNEQSGTIHP